MLQERFTFQSLDTETSDERASAGTLRVCSGLVWDGGAEAPHLAIAPPAEVRATAADPVAAPIVDAHVLADGRLLVVTRVGVAIADADGDGFAAHGANLYTFADPTPTRRAQFAAAGAYVVVATRTGAGHGTPSDLLVYTREPSAGGVLVDRVRPYAVPPLPRLAFDASRLADENGLPDATYSVRLAYRMRDGSIGPLGPPVLVELVGAPAGESWTLDVKIDGDVPAAALDAGVEALVVYLSAPEAMTWPLFGYTGQAPVALPVYRVAESAPLREIATDATLASVRMTDKGIIAGEQGIDGHLLAFGVTAATAYGYNGRVILADVRRAAASVDALDLFVTATETGAGADVPVRVDVLLDLPDGRAWIQGPTRYIPAADAAAAPMRGHFAAVLAVGPTEIREWRHGPFGLADARAIGLRVMKAGARWAQYAAHRVGATAAAEVPATLDFTGIAPPPDPVDVPQPPTVPSAATDEPHLLVWTEPFAPFALYATNAQPVGEGGTRVLQIVTQAEAASAGQFGEHPLLVCSSGGYYLAATGTDLFINAIVPLATRYGAASRQGAAPAAGAVVAITTHGAFLFTPQPTVEITAPVRLAFEAATTENAAAGFAAEPRPRLLLAPTGGAGDVYCVDVETRALSTLDGAGYGRSVYLVAPRPDTLAVSGAGALVAEFASEAEAAQPFAIETALVGFGDPYAAKRIRRMTVRARPRAEVFTADLYAEGDAIGARLHVATGTVDAPPEDAVDTTFATPRAHGYRFALRVSGSGAPGATLHGFEYAFEARRPSRPRY